MGSSTGVTIKLLVDKEKSRVVLAESDKDFVDILFGFLLLPLGTIIRVLGKDSSSLGSLANIYHSVATLDQQYLQTRACKNMLLRPRNAAALQCENLIIDVDNSEPRKFYLCHECSTLKLNNLYSSVPDTFCSCGRPMNRAFEWGRRSEKANGDGVFVKGRLIYIITDDLNVTLASTAVLKSLFKSLSVEDASMLEERILQLCPATVSSKQRFLSWCAVKICTLCPCAASLTAASTINHSAPPKIGSRRDSS